MRGPGLYRNLTRVRQFLADNLSLNPLDRACSASSSFASPDTLRTLRDLIVVTCSRRVCVPPRSYPSGAVMHGP